MKSEFERKWVLFIDFFVMFLLIALDQYTKYLAVVNLKDRPAIPVIVL